MPQTPHQVSVRLFAAARDKAGADVVPLRVSIPATIGEIRTSLAETTPALQKIAPHLLFAVGTEYVRDDFVVHQPVEVVAFPPVSGG